MAVASMPATIEGTTEFPAHFALLKRKRKTCLSTGDKKFPLIKVNKRALFWKFESRTNRVLRRVNRASNICLLI